MTEKHPLREALLGAGSIDDCDRTAYDRAVTALYERKFSFGERLRYGAATLGGGAMAMTLSILAWTEPATTPWTTRLSLGVLATIGLFWCVVCGRALWLGRVGILDDRRWIARGALTFSILQTLFFAWRASMDGASDAQRSGLILSVAFVVVAATLTILQRLQELDLHSRERDLRNRLERAGR